MKKIYCFIGITLALLSFAVCAGAQEARPIWVVGHGANWAYSTDRALELGANGVEVDVRTRPAKFFQTGRSRYNTKGAHWSLGHDYFDRKELCDIGNPNCVSLEWLLTGKVTNNYTTTLDDDERFCLLWLDVKDEEYLTELVNYVHDRTPYGTEYSIIYNVYEKKSLAELEWLDENLRDNEYINFGNMTIGELKSDLEAADFSPEKHFFTRGIFNINQPKNTTKSKRNDINQALRFAEDGEFCYRVSDWSNVTANNANAWVREGAEVVLIYFDKGYRPTVECKKSALANFTQQYRGLLSPIVPSHVFQGTYIADRSEPF